MVSYIAFGIINNKYFYYMSFFDFIFVAFYRSIDKLDGSFIKIIPLQKDTLFSSIWCISFSQAMNLFTLYGIIVILLKQFDYFKIDITLYISIATSYLFNYLYFQRTGRYKWLLSKTKVKKYWYVIAYCYMIFSAYFALSIVFGYKYLTTGSI